MVQIASRTVFAFEPVLIGEDYVGSGALIRSQRTVAEQAVKLSFFDLMARIEGTLVVGETFEVLVTR